MRDSIRGFGREFHRFFGYEATPEPSAKNRSTPRWMKRKRQIFLSPASVAASIRNPYGTVKRLLLTHRGRRIRVRAGDYTTAAVDICRSAKSLTSIGCSGISMQQIAKSLSNGEHPEILSAAAPRSPVTQHLPHQPRPHRFRARLSHYPSRRERGPSVAGTRLHLARPSQADQRGARDRTMISRAPRCYDLSIGALPLLRRRWDRAARGQVTG